MISLNKSFEIFDYKKQHNINYKFILYFNQTQNIFAISFDFTYNDGKYFTNCHSSQIFNVYITKYINIIDLISVELRHDNKVVFEESKNLQEIMFENKIIITSFDYNFVIILLKNNFPNFNKSIKKNFKITLGYIKINKTDGSYEKNKTNKNAHSNQTFIILIGISITIMVIIIIFSGIIYFKC